MIDSSPGPKRRVLPGALLLTLLGALVGGPLVLLHASGLPARARVVDKQERFGLSEGGWWRHELEITYKYRPADATVDMTSSAQVDPATFDRLAVGDDIPIHYSPIPFLRYARQYGSAIDGVSIAAQFLAPTDDVSTADLLLVALAILLAVVAYRTEAPVLIAAATAAVATVCSAIVLLGAFVLPLVFGMWRAKRQAAFGWGLLAALLLTPQLLFMRIPAPPEAPGGATLESTGTVRDVRTVTAVWPGYRRSGQSLPQPFDAVDVVFTPAGAADDLHVVDRVDSGSIALRRDGKVAIVYSRDAPAHARLAGGTRTYDHRLFVYLLEFTYGGAAVLAFVIVPAWLMVTRWFGRLPVVRRIADARGPLAALAELPDDDPRRAAIIARLRERGVHIPPDALRPMAGGGGDGESSQKRGC